jgi:hypothetical protein
MQDVILEANQRIITSAPEENVGSAAGGIRQEVTTSPPKQKIGIPFALEFIRTIAAKEPVTAAAALHPVIS